MALLHNRFKQAAGYFSFHSLALLCASVLVFVYCRHIPFTYRVKMFKYIVCISIQYQIHTHRHQPYATYECWMCFFLLVVALSQLRDSCLFRRFVILLLWWIWWNVWNKPHKLMLSRAQRFLFLFPLRLFYLWRIREWPFCIQQLAPIHMAPRPMWMCLM